MTLVKLSNKPVNKSFNNFMNDLFATVPSLLSDDFVKSGFRYSTPANVKETEDEYVLDIAAPGFQKEDFRISFEKNILTVSAEKRAEEKDDRIEKYIRKEFTYASFTRSFTIDENINAENIAAKYLNGILTLNLPKKVEVKTSQKEITIQ